MTKKNQKDHVYMAMKDILAGCPDGMRAGELSTKIKHKIDEDFPDVFSRSRSVIEQIAKYISEHAAEKDDIVKDPRKGEGTFYFMEDNPPSLPDETPRDETYPSTKRTEEDFYASFAQYLTSPKDENDDESYLKECTEAIAVGGNKFGKEEWLTPDVIGVFKPWHNCIVQFPHEIISAEIKATPDNPIKALGQACAYRLFSHKVYLAMPKPLRGSDRLEALCRIHGIGLVYFKSDADEITPSIYDVKFFAQRHTPDMDFVNSVIPKKIIKDLYKLDTRD